MAWGKNKENKKCPNCGQYKLEPRWARASLIGWAIMIVGIIFAVAIIGLPLIPIGIIWAIVAIFVVKGRRCTNCSYVEIPEKKPAEP